MTAHPPLRALVFDLMGTVLHWHSSLLPVLEALPPHPALPNRASLSALLISWRAGFFVAIQARFEAGEEQEDIDLTHRRVLDRLLEERGIGMDGWGEQEREALVKAWHTQTAWPDSIAGLERLRKEFFVVVLANGTTRLQLDIVSSSGVPFHALFSSELLGLTKPDPAIYRRCLSLLQLKPEETMMVAAHAYDTKAAQAVGMRTAYVRRTTEDVGEDFERVKSENELYVEGREGSGGGLLELAEKLGA
ncbi:haloacid dehalogenase [Leucosporidium creatinivorum]|uniref:Haloacid dehalogenase n=1 Tax=Leucosporidium creatinivorum TaxID=106004 RepID=A0A1Y2CJS3_9BASI|nr:haloacid dehalogenase [Leucosporidium creatinivorum]